MSIQFRKATRRRAFLRFALCGPAGSGKSYTGLRVAMGLLDRGERLAVIDTEHGSAELYADEPNPDGGRFDFDCVRLDLVNGKFSPENYIAALRTAAAERYPVVLVDSLSHAWAGEGGVLDLVDNVAAKQARGGKGNNFSAWRDGTKAQNELVDALLSYPGHLVCTLRTKVEFVQEVVNGRTQVRKVGLATIQRDGVDYEFTVVGDLDVDTHRLVVTKSRCSSIADRTFPKPGADLARELKGWLDQGGELATEEARRPSRREEDPSGGDDDGPPWTDSQDQSPLSPSTADAGRVEQRPQHAQQRMTEDEIARRLATANLTIDEASWYAATHGPERKPLAQHSDELLTEALRWFTSTDGAQLVHDKLTEVRDAFSAAWFSKWNLMYPTPRKKDGATDEVIERAEARSESDRRCVLKRWYGVDRMRAIPLRPMLKGDHNLTWLRHVQPADFEREILAELREPSGEAA